MEPKKRRTLNLYSVCEKNTQKEFDGIKCNYYKKLSYFFEKPYVFVEFRR